MPNLLLFRKLSPRTAHTHRLDLTAAIFFGVGFGYFETLPGLIQSVMEGEDWSVNFVRIVRPGALLLAGWAAVFMRSRPKVPWIAGTRGLGALLLIAMGLFLSLPVLLAGQLLFFIILTASFPALNGMYKENYPENLRFQLVGNIRVITTLAAATSAFLMTRYLTDDPEIAFTRLGHATIGIGVSGLIGSMIFSRIKMRSDKQIQREIERENGERQGWRRFITTPPVPALVTGTGNAVALDQVQAPEKGNKFSLNLLQGLGKFRSDALFREYMIGYFLFGFGIHFFNPALDLFLRRDLQVSNVDIGLIYATIPQATAAVTIVFAAMLLDKFDIFTSRTIATLIWLGVIALTIFSAIMARNPELIKYALPIIYISQVLRGFAFAGSTLLWATSTTYFAKDAAEATSYNAVHLFLTGVRGLIAPTLAIIIIKLGMPYLGIFAIASVFLIGSALVTLRMALRWRSWSEEERQAMGRS